VRSLLTRLALVLFFTVALSTVAAAAARPVDYQIGVFYFPGWHSSSDYWNDLKGLPGSRSPGRSWDDRLPLLGYYPEEEPWVSEKHIDWAAMHGIDFFAYDWYWNGNTTYLDHAISAFLKAKNNSKLKFCLLWANHSEVPRSMPEFDTMVALWLERYFRQPTFYRVEGKPVVFVFDYGLLDQNARKFGTSGKALLERAVIMAQAAGLPGVYFVATTNDRPSNDLEARIKAAGYSAYTGWNYVVSRDPSITADYSSMVDTYLDYYDTEARTDRILPYLVPASPGWDKRPWKANKPFVHVRENSTPAKFEKMLVGAKRLLDRQTTTPKILMIEAWNEFGEGAYIEPTKKWGMQYLEAIRKVFGGGASRK